MEQNTNPDVRAARPWEWTGFLSLLLVLVEWGQAQLGLWPDPPRWVAPVLAAAPFVIRYLRERLTGVPASYRRLHPWERT